ncbi:MAG TPA: twin-arginine translocase TatA/TatE family subunit [Syntrophomonadaceae bacterium]|nr:twin-arginine translocase TatA/TatE family subunit [Syntrophomonadaceae bacterium]
MFGFLGNVGIWELVLILLVALLVVGPSKLPEVARSLGKGVQQFQKSVNGMRQEFDDMMNDNDEPVRPEPVVSAKDEIIIQPREHSDEENQKDIVDE